MFGISHRLKGNRRANETGPDTAILQPVVLLLLAARSRFGERRLHKHNCCSSRTRPLPSRVTFYFGKEEPTLKRGCCCMFSCSRLGCLYYSVPCPGNANCRRRRGSNRAIPSSCRPRRPAGKKRRLIFTAALFWRAQNNNAAANCLRTTAAPLAAVCACALPF